MKRQTEIILGIPTKLGEVRLGSVVMIADTDPIADGFGVVKKIERSYNGFDFMIEWQDEMNIVRTPVEHFEGFFSIIQKVPTNQTVEQ